MSLLLKLVYSAILFGIAGLALREFWTVWFDTRVYIGKFEVISESGKDAGASDAFAKRIVAAQSIFVQQLTNYQTRHSADAPSDTTYAIAGVTPLMLPPDALGGVDITVQEINLRQVLTAIRRGFLAPNEVSGQVTERQGSVLAAVEWPRAPALADGGAPLSTFLAPSRATAQEVAAYIACSISWARAASQEKSLAAFPHTQICDFASALGDLYALEEKASTAAGLEAEQTKLVRKRVAILRSHYGASAVFPDIYRLRADLLDLLPEGERTQNELVEAQEDRLRYAMLSPALKSLPAEEKRMTALALARPAIVLEDGKPRDARDNWAGLLGRHLAEIGTAAAATGLVLNGEGQPMGSGFIVAPGVMMTTYFVADASNGRPLNTESTAGAKGPQLCLGSSASDCGTSLKIGNVLYKEDNAYPVLMELVNHDPVLNPPLVIADVLPEPNTFVGRYAYVVGYPFPDPRMPPEFVKRLLGDEPGRKRLMPGRVLAFGASGPRLPGAFSPHSIITSDMSTSGGTGGGPFLDLLTGKVVGVSYGGLWQGERGKFAYAEPIPAAALDLINRRLQGPTDERATPMGQGKKSQK